MRTILFYIVFLSAFAAKAQFSIATYQSKERLPESNWLNPAFMPDNKLVIGLPGLSSVAFDAGMGFSFNDIFVRDMNDSLVIDKENFPLGLKKRMDNSLDLDIQLLMVGIRMGQGYISFGSRLRSESRVNYTSELIKWALLGPGDNRVSNTIDLNDFQAFSATYLEYSATYARQITDKLTVGVRVKHLNGLAGGEGSQDGSLHISADSVTLILNNSEYNMSGFNAIGNYSPSEFLSGPNNGYGIDVGIDFELSESMSFSGSLTDIGFINWKTDIQSYRSENINYKFKGVDVVQLMFDPNSANPSNELDSLVTLIKPQEQTITSFRTGLNGKATAGVHYDLNLLGSIGGTVYSGLNGGKLDPVIGVNYQLKLKSILTVLAGITYKDKSIENVMAGLIVKPGPVQVYVLTDRLNSYFVPANANSLNLRFGMNIAIGKAGVNIE
ncbi:MAG: DUF5723 family protein [Cyclobacteriaceae bacterium]|nr:DUF5723 family protein [Cyclobacteriaceae bacterium]